MFMCNYLTYSNRTGRFKNSCPYEDKRFTNLFFYWKDSKLGAVLTSNLPLSISAKQLKYEHHRFLCTLTEVCILKFLPRKAEAILC